MDSTLAALLGAVIGGALSVLASWLAQRVFADFGNACRAELLRLQPHRMVLEGPLGFRLMPLGTIDEGRSRPAE